MTRISRATGNHVFKKDRYDLVPLRHACSKPGERERGREREREQVCGGDGVGVYGCVCVCERERERERMSFSEKCVVSACGRGEGS